MFKVRPFLNDSSPKQPATIFIYLNYVKSELELWIIGSEIMRLGSCSATWFSDKGFGKRKQRDES